jgi:hypothetical protein
MAAGLGFKDFTTGEVLTAADVDGYLMQGVWVFASAAARDAAVTAPQEGNFAYLKDTNVTTYYTGSAWANLDTTGMTNPMTTTGDTIYSSSGSTPARLGIGSTGQVLTVAGGVPTWATSAASGGMTVLASGTLSSGGTTLSSINQTYKNVQLVLRDYYTSVASSLRIRLNADTGTVYPFVVMRTTVGGGTVAAGNNAGGFTFDDVNGQLGTSAAGNHLALQFFDYANTNTKTTGIANFVYTRTDAAIAGVTQNCTFTTTGAITEINIAATSGNLSGTYILYGVN